MLKVGITGGIGSGKSTVAKIFELLGVPVYYADDAAKKLMSSDLILKQKIQEYFGENIYQNNILDRKALAALVFNAPEKLTLLNSFVHPATIADAEAWMLAQTAPYIIKEAAILFESGSHKQLDKIIGVSAPLPLRVQRAMQRDNISAEQIMERVARQMNEEEKMRLCDHVIYNDEQQLLIPQVIALHQQLSADISH